jgi:hypothetical protein
VVQLQNVKNALATLKKQVEERVSFSKEDGIHGVQRRNEIFLASIVRTFEKIELALTDLDSRTKKLEELSWKKETHSEKSHPKSINRPSSQDQD